MAEERERSMPERREERAMAPYEEWLGETPMRMLQRMREDIDRMFSQWPAFGRMMQSMPMIRQMMPSVDIWETENEVKLTAELPGVEPDNVEIFTTEDTIRIRGEMRKEEEKEEKGMYRMERRYGTFDRTIPLPAQVQSDQAKATFRHGVLEVTLPKTQQAKEKMKKVPIETQEQMAGSKRGEAKEEEQKKSKK